MCRVARELPPPIKLNTSGVGLQSESNNSIRPSSVTDVAVKVSNERVQIKSVLVNRQCQLFEIGPIISEGKFGNTNVATLLTNTHTPQEYARDEKADPVAIKIYSLPNLKKLSQKFIANPWQEIDLYQILDTHPFTCGAKQLQSQALSANANLVKLKEVCIVNQTIYMMFPHFPDGNLASMLETKFTSVCMPIEEVQKVVRDIGQALLYLHECDVVHNHVTLDNIYYSKKEGKYYLHDLSMAIRVPMTASSTASASFPCGQEGCFVPPEVLANCASASNNTEVVASFGNSPHVADHQRYCEERRDLFARDVWALGVAAYVLLTGSAPMERAVSSDGCYQVVAREEKLVELYRQMLREAVYGSDNAQESADEIDRVEGIEGEVLDDEEELLFAGLALVQKMLLEDPRRRIAVKDIVCHAWVAQVQSQAVASRMNESEDEATDAELGESRDWKQMLRISTVGNESEDERGKCVNCDDNDCDSDNVMDEEGVVRDPSLMRVNANVNVIGALKRKATATITTRCCNQRSPLSSACSSPINLPKKRKVTCM